MATKVVTKHREALEAARRRTALQVDTVAHAVTSVDDAVGWTRLTELGTASTVRAQQVGVSATAELLNAALDAVGAVADIVDLPGIEPGRLASGRDVAGMFAKTQKIVRARMAGGQSFPEALDASANVLSAIASSEPHRVARDGQFNTGLADSRFDRYRRVAVGTTCAFCRMLATRGAVYLTPESAGRGRQYHYKCDCYVELVPADAIAATTGLQGDWRNAISDPQRLRDAGALRDDPPLRPVTAFDRPTTTALSPGAPRAALRTDTGFRELQESDILARMPGGSDSARALAAKATARRFKVYADGDVMVRVRRSAADPTQGVLADDEVQRFLGEWRGVTEQVYRDMPDGYPSPMAIIDDTDMTWTREKGTLAYVNDSRFDKRNAGVVHIRPRAARGDFDASGSHFAPVIGSATTTAEDRIRYVLMHEMGHLHHFAWDDAFAMLQLPEAVKAGAKVSTYGGESHFEGYAEAFAEWMLARRPSVAARRYARVVGWEAPA